MKIHATTPACADYNDFSLNGAHYFEDTRLLVQIWNDSISLTDITDAMKAGRKCRQVRFVGTWGSDRCHVANLLHHCADDFQTVFTTLLAAGPSPQAGPDIALGHATGRIYKTDEQAARVFSPFASLNPLKEAPKKWTLPHVVRALLNGQFSDLRCNGKYSDDYAFDAAYNFFKGAIPAAPMVEELITSPSGWWTSGKGDGERVSVCCHSFDNRSFVFQLNPTPNVTEQIGRLCANNPELRAEVMPNGNALLSTQNPAAAAVLETFATQLHGLGVTVEQEAVDYTSYLAIYPAKQAA